MRIKRGPGCNDPDPSLLALVSLRLSLLHCFLLPAAPPGGSSSSLLDFLLARRLVLRRELDLWALERLR